MITYLNNFAVKYPKISSAIHTFLATFIVTFLAILSQIPASAILDPKTWTVSSVAGILVAAARAGIKAISPLV